MALADWVDEVGGRGGWRLKGVTLGIVPIIETQDLGSMAFYSIEY